MRRRRDRRRWGCGRGRRHDLLPLPGEASRATCGIPCDRQEPVQDRPNLYVAAPRRSAPLHRHPGARQPRRDRLGLRTRVRHTADFQTTADGHFAAFPSTLALAGKEEETAGHTELYRYDAAAATLACASCTPTGIPSGSEASLASDGRASPTTARSSSTLRSARRRRHRRTFQDAYQWEPKGTGNCEESSPTYSRLSGACTALISSGTSQPSTPPCSAVSARRKGRLLLHPRQPRPPRTKTAPPMKIYDARDGGGFPFVAARTRHARPPTSATGPRARRHRRPNRQQSGLPDNPGEGPSPASGVFVKHHGALRPTPPPQTPPAAATKERAATGGLTSERP